MKEYNFCPSCGKDVFINGEELICDCGAVINSNRLISSQRGLIQFDDEKFLPESFRGEVEYLLGDILKQYKLDGLYFRASSAKKDLNKKVDFIKDTLIPSLNEWKEILELCERDIIKHKSTIAIKIFNIINLILMEYFGPFKFNPVIKEFQSFRDFSIYNVRLDMENNNLNFDIQGQLSLSNVVGGSIESGVNAFFSSNVFERAEKSNRELTKDDLKAAGIGAGISILGNMVTGISSIMGQNSDIIEKVRKADLDLNSEIDKINKTTQSLAIHENEIIKRKKVLVMEEAVLNYCQKFSLNLVFEKCFNEALYIEYKEGRYNFDVGVLKSRFEEDILNEKVEVSFWRAILGSKRMLFKKAWKERLKNNQNIKNYNHYNEILSINDPTILEDIYLFKEINVRKFKEYEKKYRTSLECLPSFIAAKSKVNTFMLVLKRINKNLDN